MTETPDNRKRKAALSDYLAVERTSEELNRGETEVYRSSRQAGIAGLAMSVCLILIRS